MIRAKPHDTGLIVEKFHERLSPVGPMVQIHRREDFRGLTLIGDSRVVLTVAHRGNMG
jgi:hypothetical protein